YKLFGGYLMRKLTHYLENNSLLCKKNIVFFTLLLISGLIFNQIWHHPNFYIYQVILLCIILLEIQAIHIFLIEFKNLSRQAQSEAELSGSIRKYESKFNSWLIIFIGIPFVILFMGSIIKNEFIKMNVTGIYGIILGIIAFVLGIIAYAYYILLLSFIRDIRFLEFSINEYAPAYSPIYISISKLLILIEKYFFIIGFLYTLIYSIMSYKSIVLKSWSINFHVNNDLMFFITWSIIIIFFILGFPCLTLFSKYLLRENIEVLKIKVTQDILNHINSLNRAENMEEINALMEIIDKIEKSKKSPIETSNSFFNKIFSAFISTITFLTPFMTIYIDYISQKG
ncbi:hypothetical protein, partial [Candidatus Enterococcus ikei]